MATTIVIPTEAAQQIVAPVVAQANSLAIKNAEDYEFACQFLTLIARKKAQIKEVFDPICQKAHEAHREAVAQRDKFLNPLATLEVSVKSKVSTFRMEQDRIRRAEEQRLAAEAKQRADEEALAQAAELEANGESEMADLVLQTAAEAPAPVVVVMSQVPKQDGISKRVNWRYEVTDESQVPREFMAPSDLKIGAVVRSQKGLTKIPGVRVWSEETVSVRGR